MTKYVELNAVLDVIGNQQDGTGMTFEALSHAMRDVMSLPQVDAVPVRHGKWIEYNATGKKQWMCSECCAEEKNPKVARFCYWCGADMRGEEE